MEGLSAPEVAARLGVADSTVRCRHRSALETLREALVPEGQHRRRLRIAAVPLAVSAIGGGTELVRRKVGWAAALFLALAVVGLWPGASRLAATGTLTGPIAQRRPFSSPGTVGESAGPLAPATPAATELMVLVTDGRDTPIAGAEAWVGELPVGRTAVDGRLVVPRGSRPRLPIHGTIVVRAAGHRAASARFRLGELLRVRLAPLDGTDGGAPPGRLATIAAAAATGEEDSEEGAPMRRMKLPIQEMVLGALCAAQLGGCTIDADTAAGARGAPAADEDPVGDDGADDPPDDGAGGDVDAGPGGEVDAGTCPYDPCSGPDIPGLFLGFQCDDASSLAGDVGIRCSAARERCAELASNHPGENLYCEWNGREIFRQEITAGSCDVINPPHTGCDAPPPRILLHPCFSNPSDPGTARLYTCGPFGGLAFEFTDIGCAETVGRCALAAIENQVPGLYCDWNGAEVFRDDPTGNACVEQHGEPLEEWNMPRPETCGSPDHPSQREGSGEYRIGRCGEPLPAAVELEGPVALGHCMVMAALNPMSNVRCEWDGTEIYRREAEPGACDSEEPLCAP